MQTRDGSYEVLGYQQLAVSSTVVALTIPTGARLMHFAVETDAIRWRDDGTVPTASVGMPQTAGDETWFTGNLTNFRAIRQNTDAVLDIRYCR